MEPVEAWHLTDRLHAEHGKGDPFAAAVRATRMAMIITDPRLDDNPIVFVNDAFLALCGYERDEIMGRNCRFLQGPDTSRSEVTRIRDAIEARWDIAVDLLNYRKDGTQFWNALYMSPVTNQAGELLYFFASQVDITDRIDAHLQICNEKEAMEREIAERTRELTEALAAKTLLVHEIDHRVKNNLQMVASLLATRARSIVDPDARAIMQSMLARIEALGTVHRLLYQSNNVTRFDVADFVRELVTDLVPDNGRGAIRLRLDLKSVVVPVERAPPIALILNELVTNALKHAFVEGRPGRLSVTVAPDGPDLRLEVRDDGVGMTTRLPCKASFGQRLVTSLARQLDATIDWTDAIPGTCALIRIPNGSAKVPVYA